MPKKIVVLLFIFIGLLQSCNTTEPPPAEKTITLTLEDAASIEAWIKLTTTNLQLPTTITLKQNNENRSTINLDKTDTLLYIDSLLPNTTYSFQVSSIQLGEDGPISSNRLQVTTLDTTSHNFAWQSWTFGEHSSSILYDVAIIDENNIWAVGEIYLNDSLGQPDPRPYGAIHWDGITWTPIKVPYHDFGSTNKFPRPLKTILAFGKDSIYVTSSANLLKLEGNEWMEKAFFMKSIPFDGQVLKMWGTDGNNIYCVGRKGAIYRYNGTLWWKMYSGTELDIYDIYGDYNTKNDEWEILAVAAERFVSFDKVILRLNNSGTELLVTEGIPYSIRGIWFNSSSSRFVVGSGIYKNNSFYSSSPWKAIHQGVTNRYIESIRGNDLNDFVACGDFGELLHFNGVGWKSFQQITNGVLLLSIAIQNNTVVTVGTDNPTAFIAVGKR